MSQQQRTILIVEDSSEDRELYRRYLRSELEYSYTILEANLGQQGLEMSQQHQLDAVLLDYRLPDMDGLEFLAKLKSAMQRQCLAVVVITGQGNEAIAVQAMKAGAQDYLVKGQISREALCLAVNGAIETVQLRTQLEQRIEREQLVAQVTQKLYQTLGLEEILQTAVNEVRHFLQTDRVLIFRLEADGWGTTITESVSADWMPLLSTSYHDPCFSKNYKDYIEAFRQGLITNKPNIQDGTIAPCHVELLANLQVRASLVVPILQNGQLWGLLIAHHCAAPRQWQPLEVELLKELATQLGVALQQAELYHQLQHELVERKQVEAKLRESEERLSFALEASHIGTWDWNIQTKKISWSENLEALFGLEPGQFDGSFEMFVAHVYPEDRERVLAAINQCITTGADYEIEFRVVFLDGTIRWALSKGKVFYDASGQPLRMAGIDIDITKRKHTEEVLRDNEQLLRLALAGARAGSWNWEIPTGKVVWSPENFDLYGIAPAPGVPQYEDWSNALHPEDRNWVNAEVAHVIAERLPEFRAEFRIVHPQRGIRWLLGIGRLTLNKQGEPIRLSGINLDITEGKQTELERDCLLAQEQGARTEAERANRVKDEFLAILSHELRSPLNPILGWAKLLQTHTFDSAKTLAALATIERNARLQTQLIDDLLDMAKILRGKLSIDAVPVNLVFVIEAALDTVKTAAIAKAILIHPVLRQIGQVSGDAARLQQVVWNLLSNAIKFTPNNGRVDVWLEQVGTQAQITIRDTGKGINPDFLPHIFESFRQEDTSVNRKYGGLGLGLAIVYQLVEAHGGTITVDSPGEGLGATFTVRLPLLDIESEIGQEEEVSEQELNLMGIRVMAVDDECDAQELLRVILTQYGAEVLTVGSASEVLTNLESFQPDVLVSDISMPEVDGYTLIRLIRALPSEKGGQIPAIALTAYARAEDSQQALNTGYQQHITKPLEPKHLVQGVAALTYNKRKK